MHRQFYGIYVTAQLSCDVIGCFKFDSLCYWLFVRLAVLLLAVKTDLLSLVCELLALV